MKKFIVALAVTILAGTSYFVIAADDLKSEKGMMMDVKKFDANGDGMLSKEEFIKAHEAMFDRMKGSNGMIAIKDMPMQGMGMMGKGNMMGNGHQMHEHMGKDAK